MSTAGWALAGVALAAVGERVEERELRQLRKTVDDLRVDLKKAREEEAKLRMLLAAMQRRLADMEPFEPEREESSIQTRQAKWRTNLARVADPTEKAFARSIAEEEWDYLRKLGDRRVQDYGW